MVTRDFSGDEVATVLVNTGSFYVDRVSGSHVIVKWVPPADHDTESRTVSIPRHNRLKLGTLRNVAEQAGARDFDRFCDWIDRNR